MKQSLLNTEIRITSLELVDLINQFREEEGNDTLKLHKTLMRDIRDEVKTLENAGIKDGYNFVPVEYVDKKGEVRPCYSINRAGVMQILNKESAVVRYKTQLYVEALENALNDVRFREGDKRHQLDCMEILQGYLPEELRQEKISYIKANTVVNKCTSDYFGFPKMLKKADMNQEMLEVRENVLDDYVKLFGVLEDNGDTKEALYKKYKKQRLLIEKTSEEK